MQPDQKYTVIFSNGGLTQLEQLASELGVPRSDLSGVVRKAIRLLAIGCENKILVDKGDGKLYPVLMDKL